MSPSILPRVLSIIQWLSKLLASHLGLENHHLSTKCCISPKTDVIQLKRRSGGYYKFENGLLDVTPINTEEEDL